MEDRTGRQLKDGWYIAYVKNNCELKVRNSIDVRCVVPIIQVTKNMRGKMKVELVPKFRNYVYLQHDGSSNFFARCLMHEDVLYFLGSADGVQDPSPVPAPEINAILEKEMPRTILRPGVPVKVTDGQFVGFEGRVDKIIEEMVTVKIPILGSEITEEIPKDYLMSIEE